jgi:glycosyltransferase involved in cell wall biosynthesis
MTLVVSNIRGGGAPFAVVNWANAWHKRGYQVTILIIHPDEGVGNDYPVDEGIELVSIDLRDRPVANAVLAFKRVCSCLYRLRKAIVKTGPDVCLCFFEPLNVRVLMACFGLSFPVIVMEQTHPGQVSFGRFWEKWRERIYPTAAAQVNLTHDASNWSKERFKLKKSAVIPNPVLPTTARADLKKEGRKTAIAAGRLVDQKGFDMLVRAFAKISDTNPDWDLVIYGEGDNRASLERDIVEFGLGKRVFLPGWTNTMSAQMVQADMFVLSSRYEGFGNVVAEALAVGLPVVSFDCKSGPGEIVRHGVDGFLVPPLDVDALAESMSVLMGDEDLRIRFGEEALDARERFSVGRTVSLWDDLFSDLNLL